MSKKKKMFSVPEPVKRVPDCCGICMYWRMRKNANSAENMPGDCLHGPVTVEKYYKDWCGQFRKPEIKS
jgi:hypothetical protein